MSVISGMDEARIENGPGRSPRKQTLFASNSTSRELETRLDYRKRAPVLDPDHSLVEKTALF
jgi:hypothetical protein